MRWTRKAIVAEIKRLHAEGAELNYATAEDNHLNLVRAAAWHFGTWRRAVESAGIEYDSISKYQRWNRERIISRIRELHSEGADLNWRAVSTEIDPPLAAAALRPNGFQSWRDAIRASGLDINGVARYQAWDEERVLKDIKALHRAGLPLSSKAVQLGNQPLFCAARRRFGSWDEALAAAGLSVQDIRLRQPAGFLPEATPQNNTSRNGAGRNGAARSKTTTATATKVGTQKGAAAKSATSGKASKSVSAASKGGPAPKKKLEKPATRPTRQSAIKGAVARGGAAKSGAAKSSAGATRTTISRTQAASKTPAASRTSTQTAPRITAGGKNVTKATPSTQAGRGSKIPVATKNGASKGAASKATASKATASKAPAGKATTARAGASKNVATKTGASKGSTFKGGTSKGTATKAAATKAAATKGSATKGVKSAAKRR